MSKEEEEENKQHKTNFLKVQVFSILDSLLNTKWWAVDNQSKKQDFNGLELIQDSQRNKI